MDEQFKYTVTVDSNSLQKFFPDNRPEDFSYPNVIPHFITRSKRFKVSVQDLTIAGDWSNFNGSESIAILDSGDGLTFRTIGKVTLSCGVYKDVRTIVNEINTKIETFMENANLFARPFLSCNGSDEVAVNAVRAVVMGIAPHDFSIANKERFYCLELPRSICKMLGFEYMLTTPEQQCAQQALYAHRKPDLSRAFSEVSLLSSLSHEPLVTFQADDKEVHLDRFGVTHEIRPLVHLDETLQFWFTDHQGMCVKLEGGSVTCTLAFVEDGKEEIQIDDNTRGV